MDRHDIKEELLEMFHRGIHLLHRSGPHWRRHGKQPPMPPAQARLLRLLAATGPVTQRSLCEILDIRSASLSELLGKMEKPGWIRRRPNDSDKRTIDINLTEEGENMLRNIGNERTEMAGEIFGNLTEEELRQLHGLLGKLIDDWEERFEDERDFAGRGGRVRGEGPAGRGPGWFERMREHFHRHHHFAHYHHDPREHSGSYDFAGPDDEMDNRGRGGRRHHPGHRDHFSRDGHRSSDACFKGCPDKPEDRPDQAACENRGRPRPDHSESD